MPGKVELATAYVNIIPSMQGAQGQITEMITGEAQTAGANAGQEMGDNMAEGLNLAMVAKAAAVVGTIAGIAAQAWGAVNEVAEYGDTIDKQSQMLSISASAYQTLNFAAQRSGASIQTFSRGIRTMTNDLADAQNGIAGATDNWDRLGVSIRNSDGSFRTIEDVMMDTIYSLADMEDVTQRNALANDIFGRSYVELIPLLNSGGDGIRGLIQECEDLGGVMSDEGVAASADFEDAMLNLQTAVQGVKNNLAEGGLLGTFTDWINAAANWVASDHPILERAFEGLTGVVEDTGETIGDLTYILSSVSEDMGPIISDIEAKFDELEQTIIDDLNAASAGSGDMLATIGGNVTTHLQHPLQSTIKDIKLVVAFAKGDYDLIARELGIRTDQTAVNPQVMSSMYRAQINAGGTGFGSVYGSMGSQNVTINGREIARIND